MIKMENISYNYGGSVHTLKCWPRFFISIVNGTKKFDLRFNDREFKVGDRILFEEYDPEAKDYYTGQNCTRQITFILNAFEGLMPGFVILGLKKW